MKGNARFAFRHFSTTFDEENRGNLLRYLAIFRQRIAKINLKYKSIYYSISDPWKFEFGYFSNVFDLKKKEVWNLNFAFLFFLNYDENKSQAERPKESFIIFIYFHLWKFKFKFKLTFFNKSSTKKIHGYFQIIFSFVSLKNFVIFQFSFFFFFRQRGNTKFEFFFQQRSNIINLVFDREAKALKGIIYRQSKTRRITF